MKPLLTLTLLCLALPAAALPVPEVRISLPEVVSAAVDHSPRLKALRDDVSAAKASAMSVRSALYPRVTFESSGRYQAEVSEMKLSLPGVNRTVNMGDNWNMSLGPSAYYTLYDKGESRLNFSGSEALVRAKERELESARRSVLLSARMAYFDFMLALEQTVLLSDSLRLAQDQYEDIRLKARAGVSSRQDELRAHQEALSRQIELRQARAGLSESVRALSALCGKWDWPDPSLALDLRVKGREPRGVEPASLYLSADTSSSALGEMKLSGSGIEGNPALLSLAESAEALRFASRSLAAGLWPKAQLGFRSSLEYPNGPVLNSYWQNALSLSVSIPLFESGRTEEKSREQEMKALSADETRRQQEDNLRRDWLKARDRLASLRSQLELNALNVSESSEIARLVYSSYKAGQSTFLEVQSANLKVLQAQFQQANNDISILLQTAVLASVEGER